MATFTDLASGLAAQRRKTRLKGRKGTIRGTQSPLSRPPGSLTDSAADLAALKEETFTTAVDTPQVAPPVVAPAATPSVGEAGGPAAQPAAQLAQQKMAAREPPVEFPLEPPPPEGMGGEGGHEFGPHAMSLADVAEARGGGWKGWGSTLADTAKAMAPVLAAPVMSPTLTTVPGTLKGIYDTADQMVTDVAMGRPTQDKATAKRGEHSAISGISAAPPTAAPPAPAGIGSTGPMGLAAADPMGGLAPAPGPGGGGK